MDSIRICNCTKIISPANYTLSVLYTIDNVTYRDNPCISDTQKYSRFIQFDFSIQISTVISS